MAGNKENLTSQTFLGESGPQKIFKLTCLRLAENVFPEILNYTKILQVLFNFSVAFQGLGILVS